VVLNIEKMVDGFLWISDYAIIDLMPLQTGLG